MKRILLTAAALCLFASPAFAAQKSRTALQTDFSTYKLRDYNPISNYDRLTDLNDSTFNKTTDTFADIGTGAISATTGTFTGTVTLDDGSGASPSLSLTDATDESATFSKVDAGFLTITTVAGDGVQVTTGNFKVGNGTPGVTQDGEDAYIEGTLEVDGAIQLDGALTLPTASVLVTAGNVTIGNGTPTVTQNGEDFYVEGTLEVDGASRFDAAITASSISVSNAITANGDITGDGGDQFSGFLHDQVASTTVAITAAQADKTFVSNSADVMTLPEASTVLGARYTFVCGTADDFDINPADGTDVIGTVASITGANTTTVLAPAAGDAIRCTDIGSTIVLEAVAADLWVSIGTANGIWTDVN